MSSRTLGTLSMLIFSWKCSLCSLQLFFLYFLLSGLVTAAMYEDQICHCIENEDEMIRQVISNFTDKPPVSNYEYIGAKYNNTDNSFEPCVCNDVVAVVSELSVTSEPDILQHTQNFAELKDNVTKALDAAANAAFFNNPALKHSYHSSSAIYKKINGSEVIFTVEFIVKGIDTNLEEKVYTVMQAAVNEGLLDGIGSFINFTVEFRLRVCPEDPDGGPNTEVSSPTNNVAGTSVYFTCKNGYRTNLGEGMIGESMCIHENLTWTTPTPAITCIEDKRCHQPPPNPENTIREWNLQNEEGTNITYSCRDVDETFTNTRAVYRCQEKTWTSVSHEIKCDPNVDDPKCGDPPQVPDHGILIKTSSDEIIYQCDTYAIRSGVNNVYKMKCKNFTWEELPESFTCIGSDTYDPHQEEENFLSITLPVSAGFAFFVLLCLLCTRADSPFCKICKGNVKEVF